MLLWPDTFNHPNSDVDIAPGKEGEVTLKQPGPVDVFCRYHPTMKLKLMVAAASKGGME